ncbi:hypothetical protein BDB00DRAFT_872485 [Zychaea mexicana]|uniref:uncharacterized protein n=1 Tax=Zychaea mexicana TaxID=64656 RepID=UPI0022FF0320|nr:uncharacterized protein BDB00DRAFT_872485 [Zychaea mexicana]KAI9493385.1 hypothetical protein BDB00DRAFT_872485 [Zychaea mexicana]
MEQGNISVCMFLLPPIHPSMLVYMTAAFWQIHTTLADPEPDFNESDEAISLADVLFVFPRLRRLRYTNSGISHAIGDLSLLETQHTLQDRTAEGKI